MRCFSKGSIIADSREEAKMLMVITSGQVVSCVYYSKNKKGQVHLLKWHVS
jgi:major membrane immunogen (membrane-anchored lipoprotein)